MKNWNTIRRVMLAQAPSGLYRRDDRCQNKVEDQTIPVVFPPLDLAYMAACLEREGVVCAIEDAPAERISWDTFRARVRAFSPDAVVLSVTQPTFEGDCQAADMIRETLPDVVIGARGELFIAAGEEIFAKARSFDFLLRGECDETLAEAIRSGSPSAVPGITYRENGSVQRNPDRPVRMDLDTLPDPARHLLRNELYRTPESGEIVTSVQAARGCPARCIFCAVPVVAGQKIRQRSVDRVFEEIRTCREKYGIRNFLFHADTFTWHKDWVIDLCKRIIDARLNIRWGCNSRVDSVDPERLEWMKKAGCWVIGFGIESGSEESLKKMRKGASTEKARRAIAMCKEAGVRTHAFFVFGFPWETEEDIRETIQFARELDTDFFDFNLPYPLPGTELQKLVESEGILDRTKIANGGYAQAAIRTKTLGPERLEALRKEALWALYLRPQYIARTLWKAGSARNLFHYTKAAVNRARGLLRS